jgi:hypothetical protein
MLVREKDETNYVNLGERVASICFNNVPEVEGIDDFLKIV